MCSYGSWRRAAATVGVATVLSLAASIGLASRSDAPATAMSCFAVAGKLTCIDTATAPPVPFMPPVIVPAGPHVDGEDVHIVIRDDGGRQVARG